jgi:HEAT repeat protein
MGLFGPPNVEKLAKKGKTNALVAALSYTKDSEIPAAAARALGRLGDRTAVQPLVDLLERGDLTNAESVVDALGRLGDARAVRPLFALLRSPSTPDRAARAATLALVQIGDRDAVLEAIDDDSPLVRRRAVIAAGMLGDERALAKMADIFHQEPSDDSRSAVLLALGGLGGAQAAATLTRLLSTAFNHAAGHDGLSRRQTAALRDSGAIDQLRRTAAADDIELAEAAASILARLTEAE